MQTISSTRPKRRHDTACTTAGSEHTCIVHMTVDTASVTTLRQLVMRVGGDAVEFIRIALCEGGTRMDVCLCVAIAASARISDAVVHQLPGVRLAPACP